jgi:hypothetical protein
MRPPYVLFLAILLATPCRGYAQDDPTGTRGVFAPGQPTPGQAVPSNVVLTPVPGQAGYSYALINGHHVIVEQRTNRIVRYLD